MSSKYVVKEFYREELRLRKVRMLTQDRTARKGRKQDLRAVLLTPKPVMSRLAIDAHRPESACCLLLSNQGAKNSLDIFKRL